MLMFHSVIGLMDFVLLSIALILCLRMSLKIIRHLRNCITPLLSIMTQEFLAIRFIHIYVHIINTNFLFIANNVSTFDMHPIMLDIIALILKVVGFIKLNRLPLMKSHFLFACIILFLNLHLHPINTPGLPCSFLLNHFVLQVCLLLILLLLLVHHLLTLYLIISILLSLVPPSLPPYLHPHLISLYLTLSDFHSCSILPHLVSTL